MSDCGICLSGEADESAYEIDQAVEVAEKLLRCCECNNEIPEGATYARATLFMGCDEDGNPCDPQVYRTCLICEEIAEAFFCVDRVWGGVMWDSFDYSFEGITTACFDRLQTPEAKTELRRRWMEWKGLAA